MIEIDDFVKLFCIINASKYHNEKECIEDASEMGHQLHSYGYFDSSTQVVPNDFLIVLNDIKKTIENKDCSVYVNED